MYAYLLLYSNIILVYYGKLACVNFYFFAFLLFFS
nr:MAG TPA: hypothetical protein [Caudoviricetes sp.]